MKHIHRALREIVERNLSDEHWSLFIADAREERARDVVALAELRDAHHARASQYLRHAAQCVGRADIGPARRLEVFA